MRRMKRGEDGGGIRAMGRLVCKCAAGPQGAWREYGGWAM